MQRHHDSPVTTLLLPANKKGRELGEGVDGRGRRATGPQGQQLLSGGDWGGRDLIKERRRPHGEEEEKLLQSLPTSSSPNSCISLLTSSVVGCSSLSSPLLYVLYLAAPSPSSQPSISFSRLSARPIDSRLAVLCSPRNPHSAAPPGVRINREKILFSAVSSSSNTNKS